MTASDYTVSPPSTAAATGFPSASQLTVQVTYKNGTVVDVTSSPCTLYSTVPVNGQSSNADGNTADAAVVGTSGAVFTLDPAVPGYFPKRVLGFAVTFNAALCPRLAGLSASLEILMARLPGPQPCKRPPAPASFLQALCSAPPDLPHPTPPALRTLPLTAADARPSPVPPPFGRSRLGARRPRQARCRCWAGR